MLAPHLLGWFALLVRWFHLMMGIAWIGASFYFVWLNNTVRTPREGGRPGVAGELFAIHGGAFYEVTKHAGAPEQLPETLHWFKWEAYLTWISGFILVLLHYWTTAGTTMVDPSVAALTPVQAIGVGAAAIFGGWFVYDGLCHSPLRHHGGLLATLLVAFATAVSWGLGELLAPKAAYLHTGAMIGTWMAANVLFVIIPGQRAVVDAMVAGQPPPLERAAAGSLRSLHNNYLTLPVLFIMISGHFPETWGHPQGWALLLVLSLSGAAYRHWVNLDERGVHRPGVLVAAFLALAAAVVATLPEPRQSGGDTVPMAQVQQIVAARCLSCHASEPIHPGILAPPKGVILEEPRQIRAHAPAIQAQVASRVMPLGNLTQMTDEERETIARWAP